MKYKKIRLGRIILTLAILMTVLICTGINVSAAKKQKLTAKTTTLMVGNTTTLTYKNAPKNLKKSKVKWTITSGKKYAKIKVAKNKKTATITALKAGNVTVQLKYKSKKVGIVKLAIKTKTTTKDTANSSDDKKTAEDKDRKTEKTEPKSETTEATTEAPKADYVAQYSYSMHLIQSPGANWTMHTNKNESGWINGNTYYIYIKTDNPDPSSFALVSSLGQIDSVNVNDIDTVEFTVKGTLLGKTFERTTDTTGTAYCKGVSWWLVTKVSGGYAFSISSATAGDLSIDIYERSSSVANGSGDITDTTQFAKVCTYTNTFVDYPTAYRAEVNRIAGLVKAQYGDKDFETMCKNIGAVMWADGYRDMDSIIYTWTRCGKLNAKRLNCSTGSDFVADVCIALGADKAYASLVSEGSTHEIVNVTYGTKSWKQESEFNTCTFDDELISANKPDLSSY